MAHARILVGDSRVRLVDFPTASICSAVCDPPYELGFMGKVWDSSGVTYDVALWREVLRVLKPGGYLLAFGGTRTYHRLATAIEDAGFEVRDSISNYLTGDVKVDAFLRSLTLEQQNLFLDVYGHPSSLDWIYASGFPKSHNLHGAWEGWGTALKPAHEPIIMARKPFKGTVEANVLANGCGALNITGCRIKGEPVPINRLEEWSGFGQMERPAYEQTMSTVGRWPANVITSYNEDEYSLKKGVSREQARRLFDWLYEDSQR